MKKNVMHSHMVQIAVKYAIAYIVNFVITLTVIVTANQDGKVQHVLKVNKFLYSSSLFLNLYLFNA